MSDQHPVLSHHNWPLFTDINVNAWHNMITLVVIHLRCNKERQLSFHLVVCACWCVTAPYPTSSIGWVCIHVPKCESVADVALQCFQDKLETAFVQEWVLLLWLADVEMICINLNQLPDAKICNQKKLKLRINRTRQQTYSLLFLLGLPYLSYTLWKHIFPCALMLHTCWLCRYHQYLDHGTDVCW